MYFDGGDYEEYKPNPRKAKQKLARNKTIQIASTIAIFSLIGKIIIELRSLNGR